MRREYDLRRTRTDLTVLNLTDSGTGNYGIDILILGIPIKIIFLSLTRISFKSMKEMRKVQSEEEL